MPDDLEEFVAARWHELYAVATVTTGDASSAATNSSRSSGIRVTPPVSPGASRFMRW